MKNADRMAGYLALGALAAVAATPPEAYGSGRMLLVVMSTFAFAVLSADGSVPTRYLTGGMVAAAMLLTHSLWLSEDVYRSVEFLGLAWSYYCLFGVFRYTRQDPGPRVAAMLAATASAVSLFGLYQFFWGFDRLYGFVESSAAADSLREGILGQLETARVFATFALPGTLWGFLILAVPLHLAFWQTGSPWRRAVLAANVALLVAVSALTQSYGFVLGLAVLAGGWAWTRPGARRTVRTAWPALVVLPAAGIVATGLYLARAASHNPIWLRVQNWMSAWEIFAAHPLGSGLNSYAVLYLRHQQPGANETQFAHNTPLQLVAELGLFGLALAAILAFSLAGRKPLESLFAGRHRPFFLALLVWGAHNLIDINVYFGSLGAVGAALAGVLFWTPAAEAREAADPGRRRAMAAMGITAALALTTSGVMFVSGELLFRARGELEFNKLGEASATLAAAARINPFDPSILYEAGQTELGLFHLTGDRARLDAARAYFARAVRRSPQRVGPHIGLALALSSEGRVREAIDQLEVAQMLHPAGTQAGNIRRLMERGREP